jgi:hypothetical protein
VYCLCTLLPSGAAAAAAAGVVASAARRLNTLPMNAIPPTVTTPSPSPSQALGFRLGVFHVEAKYTSRGPRLIEVNARMGGGPVR